MSVSPPNGRTPHNISYVMTPKLKMSLRWSTVVPAACSGDMYATVPRTTPGTVTVAVDAADAADGIHHFGQAEVGELRVARLGYEHVLRLDVTMDEARLVCGGERFGDAEQASRAAAELLASLIVPFAQRRAVTNSVTMYGLSIVRRRLRRRSGCAGG